MKATCWGGVVPPPRLLAGKSREELHVASHEVDCDTQWTEERIATKVTLCVVWAHCVVLTASLFTELQWAGLVFDTLIGY